WLILKWRRSALARLLERRAVCSRASVTAAVRLAARVSNTAITTQERAHESNLVGARRTCLARDDRGCPRVARADIESHRIRIGWWNDVAVGQPLGCLEVGLACGRVSRAQSAGGSGRASVGGHLSPARHGTFRGRSH